MSRSRRRRRETNGGSNGHAHFREYVEDILERPRPANLILSGVANGSPWEVRLRIFLSDYMEVPIVHYQGKRGRVPCRLPPREATVPLRAVERRCRKNKRGNGNQDHNDIRSVASGLNTLMRRTDTYARVA